MVSVSSVGVWLGVIPADIYFEIKTSLRALESKLGGDDAVQAIAALFLSALLK